MNALNLLILLFFAVAMEAAIIISGIFLGVPVDFYNLWLRSVFIVVGIVCLVIQPYLIWSQYDMRRFIWIVTLLGVTIAMCAIFGFKNSSFVFPFVASLGSGAVTAMSYAFGKFVYKISKK
jgi:hypothetical protein